MTGLEFSTLLQTDGGTAVEQLSSLSIVLLIVISLGIGLIGGLVGIALGIIRLPVMTVIFGIDLPVAAATNPFVSGVSSLAAAWPAITQDRVAFRVVLILGVPALIGSFFGGRYATAVPSWVLLTVVAIFLLWSSVSLTIQAWVQLRTHESERVPEVEYDGTITRKTIVREGLVGVVIGLIGGAVGVALGVLRVPVLVQVLKMNPGLAAGTNLFITILVTIAGFVGHLSSGSNDWLLIVIVGTPATVGMYLGSRFTERVDPIRLRLVVGLTLGVASLFVFYDAIK
jgi:uncharacterized membrane protein YfcA